MKNKNNGTLVDRIIRTGIAITTAGMLAFGIASCSDRRDLAFDHAVEMYRADMADIRRYAFHNFSGLDETTQEGIYSYLDKIDGIVASRYNVQVDKGGTPIGWISENGWKPQVSRAPRCY